MNIYKQEGKSDCMLACIANAVQKPINEIFNKKFRSDIEQLEGTHGDHIDKAFRMAGLSKGTDYFRVHIGGTLGNFMNANMTKELLQGRRAIIQVASLNNPNAYHMVYWAGETLYDPSNKQVYQWINQLIPVFVWIFNEV